MTIVPVCLPMPGGWGVGGCPWDIGTFSANTRQIGANQAKSVTLEVSKMGGYRIQEGT